jgi:DNA-binding response OmpR family regulator
MTVAWITARTDPRLFKTLCAGPLKIKTYAPTEFMPCHMLMPGNTDIIVIEIFDRTLLDLCQVICRRRIAPVLAVVADLAYAQAALEAGADDFILAPVDPIEVLLRLQRLTRLTNIVRVGDVEIDLAAWRVSSHGRRINLSRIEFRLLASLVRRVGQIVNHTTILGDVWASKTEDDRTFAWVKIYIGRLRRKIEPDFQNPQYIISIHGIGYRFQNQKQWELTSLRQEIQT